MFHRTDGLRLLRCSSLEDDLFVLGSEPALPCELGTRLVALGMTIFIGLALPSILGVAAVKAWRGGRIGMEVPSEARLERRKHGLRSEWRRIRGIDATEREVELHLTDTESLRRYGFFVEGYRPGMAQGWELIVLVRKLLLVLVLVGLEPAGVPQLQGLLGLWVCFFALLCQWRWRPLARSQHNTLEELSLVANAMILLSGLLWSSVSTHTTASAVDDNSDGLATNDDGPAAAYEAATSGSGSGVAQLAAWLCVLVSHSLLGVHLIGAWCVASCRYCRVRYTLWCQRRAMRRAVRRMTVEERNEAETARREAQFIHSGDVSSIPKAKPDPMIVRHDKLAANNKSLQQVNPFAFRLLRLKRSERYKSTITQCLACINAIDATAGSSIDAQDDASDGEAHQTCGFLFCSLHSTFLTCPLHCRRLWRVTGKRWGLVAWQRESSWLRSATTSSPYGLLFKPWPSAQQNCKPLSTLKGFSETWEGQSRESSGWACLGGLGFL